MLMPPRKYTDDKKAEALIEWYLSQNILKHVMEYVMYSLIKVRVEIAGRLGIRTQEPISCQRNHVVKALCREYPDDRENLVFLSWREELERIEDLHYSGTS